MEQLTRIILDYLNLTGLPAELAATFMILVLAGAVLGIGMMIGGLMSLLERRLAGRIQSRIGPNRVGPNGLLQWVADALKLIMKEDIVPAAADKPLFRLAPYLIMMGVFSAFVSLPFGQLLIAADLNVGILYMLAITSLVTVGILMSGWASNNKWSLIGGIRSAAQIVSYEIPIGVSILSVILLAGSLSMQDIILAQGGWPWQWFIFRNPFTFIVFFLYFTAALAEGNRTPFDLPEAESELVSGYNTEYSGMRFGAFFTGEFANIYLMSAIAATLFFGGWQIPGIAPGEQGSSMVLQFLGLLVFVGKAAIGCCVVVWVRWTLPRLRVDQLMALCYKYLIPLSFLCLGANALYLLLIPENSLADKLVGYATAAVGGFFIFIFFRRVSFHLGRAGGKIDLDFLARGVQGAYRPDIQVRPYGRFRKTHEKRGKA